MMLEGGAGTRAALNREATAAVMGATHMVDRTGIMDKAATAEEKTARTNATPPTFPTGHCDKLGLNAPMAGDGCA